MAWDRNAPRKCKFCRMEGKAAKAAKAAKRAAGAEGAAAEAGPKDAAAPLERGAADPLASRQGPVVNYKDVRTLQRLTTPQGKIFSRKRSGTCASHQRQVKHAIKRARFLALLPYVGR